MADNPAGSMFEAEQLCYFHATIRRGLISLRRDPISEALSPIGMLGKRGRKGGSMASGIDRMSTTVQPGSGGRLDAAAETYAPAAEARRVVALSLV